MVDFNYDRVSFKYENRSAEKVNQPLRSEKRNTFIDLWLIHFLCISFENIDKRDSQTEKRYDRDISERRHRFKVEDHHEDRHSEEGKLTLVSRAPAAVCSMIKNQIELFYEEENIAHTEHELPENDYNSDSIAPSLSPDSHT